MRGVRIFYGGIMFKALIRRIVEAVRGAIENEQERTDLSVRIPAGYLVACRRAHVQRKRHTPKRRRQRREKVENADLKKHVAHIESEGSKKAAQLNEKIRELKEDLETIKAQRDQERDARNAAENRVQELKEKKFILEKDLADVSKKLERKTRFPHLEFGPDAVRDYGNLHSDVLPMVERRLDLLNESFMEWCVNGGKEPFLTRQAHWWRCDARDEGNRVKDDPKLRDQRLFRSCHDGEEYFFWHINCGELGDNPGRIHFRFDEITHEVEVGYIGGHLPTALFRN